MPLFFYAVSFVCGIVVASLLWRHEVGPPPKKDERFDGVSFPFDKRECLFDENEQVVYRTLQRELAKTFQVFPKVQLGETVKLNRKTSREQFYNRLLGGRHIDFLLCDRDSYKPMLAIQLVSDANDDEHDVTYDVLKSAEIAYLRLPQKKAIAPSELAYMIAEKLKSRKKRKKDVVDAEVL